LETSQEIFVVNLTNIVIFLAVFIPVGAVLFQRRRKHPPEEAEVSIPEFPAPLRGRAEELLVPEKKAPLAAGDFIGRVLLSYIEATRLAESATGILIKPYMTLREFAREVEPKLNNGREAFDQLTHLAERALYSPFVPTEAEASQSESWLAKLKEELTIHH
jgi:hypothetical protein